MACEASHSLVALGQWTSGMVVQGPKSVPANKAEVMWHSDSIGNHIGSLLPHWISTLVTVATNLSRVERARVPIAWVERQIIGN